MWINILLVGTGSMLGGISRYLFTIWIKQLFPLNFPLGTFAVNMIGCFIIGLLSGWTGSYINLTVNHKLLLMVGFCGSFTTFSTFSLDNMVLLTSKAYPIFFLNIILSVVAGLFATWGGLWVSQKM